MKKLFILPLLLSVLYCTAQTTITITLQPGTEAGKDALVWNAPGYSNGNTNYGNSDAIGAHAWTNNSQPDTSRTLLQFDLSSIPPGSLIISAKLSLFNAPDVTFANGNNSSLTASNAFYIRRITSSWNENSVTWFTQPSVSSLHQVKHAGTDQPHKSFPNTKVTQLVQDMINNPTGSFGFELRLVQEKFYAALVFASSEYYNASKHPKLVITYAPPMKLKPVADEEQILVYPNPAIDFVNINLSSELNSDAIVHLINITGEIVLSQTFDKALAGNTVTMNLSDLPKGIYFLQMMNGSRSETRKIVKM